MPQPKALKAAPWLLLPSGASALMLQVVWMRLLGLSLGSTSASIATVLAAFFAGLALGSLLAGRLVRGSRSPLAVFAMLEAVIAVSAVALVPALLAMPLVVAALPDAVAGLPGSFAIAFCLLLVPTTAMGATWPVLAQATSAAGSRQSDLAQLYGLNTIGAVFGALGAAWLAVPAFGLDGAAWIAAGIDLAVAGVAWRLAAGGRSSQGAGDEADTAHAFSPDLGSTSPRHGAGADSSSARDAVEPSATSGLAFVVLAVTGAVTLSCEVAWSRALGLLTGTTMTGFAAILASVLTGLALGSVLAARMPRQTRGMLVGGLVALGGALLATRTALAALPYLIESTAGINPTAETVRLGVTVVLLAPPTIVLGALYPTALSALGGASGQLASRLGLGIAINTLAGIAASLATGFVLLPRLGSDATLLGAAGLTLAVGALAGLSLRGLPRLAVPLLAVALLLAAPRLPGPDTQRLLLAAQTRWGEQGDPEKTARPEDTTWYYVAEGKEGIVATFSTNGKNAVLQNDGLRESWVGLKDPLSGLWAESMLGLVPWLLHEDPRSAFVIGFGGGTTTRALSATDLPAITVVELDRAVVDAMSALPGRPLTELEDPRVTLRIADARHVLVREPTRYDVIVSQPSHPWVAGAGHLFTREFFTLASSRLTDRGVYGQWLNLFRMDGTTLRSVLASFYDVFEYGFALADTDNGDLLLFGARQPLTLDATWLAERMAPGRVRAWFSRHHIPRPVDLLDSFALSRNEALAAAADSPLNTDLSILTEVRVSSSYEKGGDDDPYTVLARHRGFDMLDLLGPQTGPDTLRLLGEILLLRRERESAAAVAETLRPGFPRLAEELDELLAAPPR